MPRRVRQLAQQLLEMGERVLRLFEETHNAMSPNRRGPFLYLPKSDMVDLTTYPPKVPKYDVISISNLCWGL